MNDKKLSDYFKSKVQMRILDENYLLIESATNEIQALIDYHMTRFDEGISIPNSVNIDILEKCVDFLSMILDGENSYECEDEKQAYCVMYYIEEYTKLELDVDGKILFIPDFEL
jgi:hypothetical protein